MQKRLELHGGLGWLSSTSAPSNEGAGLSWHTFEHKGLAPCPKGGGGVAGPANRLSCLLWFQTVYDYVLAIQTQQSFGS